MELDPTLKGSKAKKEEEKTIKEFGLIKMGSGIITPEMFEKAKRELNETEENTKIGLKYMKEYIKKNRLQCCEDDNFLLRFLRVKKFQSRRSVDALKRYISNMSAFEPTFGKADPEAIKKVIKMCTIGVLPYRDSEGRAITYLRTGVWYPEHCPMEQVCNAGLTTMFYLMTDPAFQINGYTIVLDTLVIPHSQIPLFMKNLTNFLPLMIGFPGRMNRIDVVNDCALIRFVFSLLKPLMPKKLRDRVMFHGTNFKYFHELYSPSILPEEYGGELGPLCNDHWLDKIDQFIPKTTWDTLQCPFLTKDLEETS